MMESASDEQRHNAGIFRWPNPKTGRWISIDLRTPRALQLRMPSGHNSAVTHSEVSLILKPPRDRWQRDINFHGYIVYPSATARNGWALRSR
jgi:hypothetical protein